jgi:N-acetylglucosaminyldiphosphoundecaprenol N-acetyl-beta-D-mannosaminyltransferase
VPLDLPTERLFGLDFVSRGTIAEVAAVLLDAGDERLNEWRCVVTPNVDHLVRYTRVPIEADVARHARVVLPDGMPIVWASRLLQRPVASRLTGADLFSELWPRLAERRTPTVMVAARDDVVDRLTADHPGLRCVVPPMFDVTDTAAVDAVVAETAALCAETEARFLVVGVSMPKHHLIASRLRDRWAGDYTGTPIVLLLGQSPEFAVGLVRRAPAWMQRSGLEWVWRLADDPRRLAKRYLVDDVAFARLMWKEWRSR